MSRKLAPGYCIVEQPGSISLQAGLLFRKRNSSAARYFEQLNAGTLGQTWANTHCRRPK